MCALPTTSPRAGGGQQPLPPPPSLPCPDPAVRTSLQAASVSGRCHNWRIAAAKDGGIYITSLRVRCYSSGITAAKGGFMYLREVQLQNIVAYLPKCKYRWRLLCSNAYNTTQYNKTQYNFIAKCQYNCTRNVLWCQAYSSHIHSNHKTSLNYNNNK